VCCGGGIGVGVASTENLFELLMIQQLQGQDAKQLLSVSRKRERV